MHCPGIDVNKSDNEGNTPLHFAAQAGKYLIALQRVMPFKEHLLSFYYIVWNTVVWKTKFQTTLIFHSFTKSWNVQNEIEMAENCGKWEFKLIIHCHFHISLSFAKFIIIIFSTIFHSLFNFMNFMEMSVKIAFHNKSAMKQFSRITRPIKALLFGYHKCRCIFNCCSFPGAIYAWHSSLHWFAFIISN